MRPNRTQIMTLKEVAAYLGLHHLTIYRLIQEKKIPAARLGGRWRFKKDVLDKWIETEMKDHFRQTGHPPLSSGAGVYDGAQKKKQ